MLENIRELQWACEIISDKFPRAEIKIFRMDVGRSTKAEIILK